VGAVLDLRAVGLRRFRGHLEGVADPAHTPDVRRQRHPRRDPGRVDDRARHRSWVGHRGPRVSRGGAGDHQRRRRLRRDRPDARDVPGTTPAATPAARWSRRRCCPMSRSEVIELIYLFCSVCFIVALKGLSSPRWARQGNLIGAAGMVVAIGATFAWPGLHRIWLIVVGIVIGTAVAIPAARAVKMTAIPQMVAAFNGVGGGAAALVSLAEFQRLHSTAGVGT